MKFVNMTPHPITIVEGEQSTVYPVGGPAPRLAVEREALGKVGGISVVRSKMGDPTGLPQQRDGVIVIVSALVAEHPSVSSRTDLAYPGEAIRDTDGKIVGARGLCAGPGLAESLARPTDVGCDMTNEVAELISNEDLLCRLFGAHRVVLSRDEVGDVVARVTFRGVTQANFKSFFHAELRASEEGEANARKLLVAMDAVSDFERNHDRALSSAMAD